jgi:KDO2-lipid IV(A) lauroyltransferase
LGWLAYLGSPTYRRRLHVHVAQAGVPWRAARPAIASAGRMVAELPWLWSRGPDERLGDLVRWEGAAHVETALAAGRGLVMLTPHIGCFEIIGQAYAERFGARQPMTALYRPARKAWLRDLVAQSRNRPGLETAPATLAGVRQMIRALRKGGTIGLLPDQVPPEGLGVWAPFFGREAYTMTLAARLVQQTGAAWLLLVCERLPAGRGYVIRVQPPAEPLPGVLDEPDAERLALRSAGVVNRAMETLIRQNPGQYLWGYHRYKAPRPIDPPAPTHTDAA